MINETDFFETSFNIDEFVNLFGNEEYFQLRRKYGERLDMVNGCFDILDNIAAIYGDIFSNKEGIFVYQRLGELVLKCVELHENNGVFENRLKDIKDSYIRLFANISSYRMNCQFSDKTDFDISLDFKTHETNAEEMFQIRCEEKSRRVLKRIDKGINGEL